MNFYKFLITILLIFCNLITFSQKTNTKIDSLIKSLPRNNDTTKLKTYNKIVAEYSQISYEKCVEFSIKKYDFAVKIKNEPEIAKSLMEIGLYTYYCGKPEKATEYFRKSIAKETKIGNKKQIAQLHCNIGAMQEVMGKYDSAFVSYQKSLQIFEQENDKSGIAFVRNNMGIVSEELAMHEKAINNYNIALKLKLELGDKKGAASTYNNLGVVYENTKNNEKALLNYQKALEIYTSIDNKKGMATLLNNIGHVFEVEKKYSKAIENYSKSLEIRKQLGDSEGITSTMSYLGILFLKTNEFQKSEMFLLDSYETAKKQNSAKFLIQNAEQLSMLYTKLNNYKKAYSYYVEFAQLRDSLQGGELKNKISELETKYETEKKEHKINSLQIENELKDEKLLKNYLIISGLMVFIAIFSISGIIFYRNRKLKNEKNNIVLEQKLLRSQMNPHFIFNSLSVIQSFIYGNEPKSAAKYLSNFAKLIRLILENSREENITLDNEIQTLEHYLELQKLRYNQKFDFEIVIEEQINVLEYKIPPMILQPFVENSIIHGILNKDDMGFIKINIGLNSDFIKIEITDNGIGRKKSAELNQNKNTKSLATQITAERIENINKYKRNKINFEIIDLFSLDNKAIGTKVEIYIPIN